MHVREADTTAALMGGALSGTFACWPPKTMLQSALETAGRCRRPAVATTYAIVDESASSYLPIRWRPTSSRASQPAGDDKKLIGSAGIAQCTWPDALPFKGDLLGPSQQPHGTGIALSQGAAAQSGARALRLSVMPSKEQLDVLGVWHWLTPTQREKLAHAALGGQHWMLTPWRTIELVHAVQKPLIAPFMNVGVMRDYAKTTARPIFEATCSIKSTDRVDLQAEWNDPIDDDPSRLARTLAARTMRSRPRSRTRNLRDEDRRPAAHGHPRHYIVKEDVIRSAACCATTWCRPRCTS